MPEYGYVVLCGHAYYTAVHSTTPLCRTQAGHITQLFAAHCKCVGCVVLCYNPILASNRDSRLMTKDFSRHKLQNTKTKTQSNKSTINHDGPASMVADVGGPYEAESPPTAENGGFIESPTPQVNDRWRRSPRGGQKVAQKGQRSKGLSLLPLAHLVFINTIEQ